MADELITRKSNVLNRIVKLSPIVLCGLYLVLPVLRLATPDGWYFELYNYAASAAALAGLTVAATVLLIKSRIKLSGYPVFFAAALPLLCIINSIAYVVEDAAYVGIVFLLCVVSIVFSAVFFFKCSLNTASKVTLGVISLIFLVLFSWSSSCACFVSCFGELGVNTVVRSVPSPDEKHYADIIDSDQGALGGDTYVDVRKAYPDAPCNTFFGEYIPSNEGIAYINTYRGEWGESDYITVKWKDNDTLIVYDKEYDLDYSELGE